MTEKDYNPEQKQRKSMKKQEIASAPKKIVDTPQIKSEKVKEKDKKVTEKEKIGTPKEEKPKKTIAIVNGRSLPISTKYSVAICNFIKNKRIEDAISDLEQVLNYKKAVPMKGEIPHRKGKIMSGRYPKKAVEHFIKLLKSLLANANELNNPLINEAIANLASRPYSKFGTVRRKRSHIKIIAKEKKWKKKK
ncbi:MAG: uL22 family ribosomal protein [Candidatus Pacearchaeota archaeon]|jgi:ribosomal protein L22|nr:hypothetical protein [Candidatus Pacearchaeota archaeon]MDP7520743.1 uL22 family ribosomal protein [Candidatus Pacearchaeota archaeon]|tara:strand:- start:140 stop:715 length:576 start_codon:yes stop_codon:yes gene_type:complete